MKTKITNFIENSRHNLNFQNPTALGIIITLGILLWQGTDALVQENRSLLNRIEYFFYDYRYELSLSQSNITTETNIAIIDIDEKSLLAEGRWPWSRQKLGEMVTKLSDLGVLVVAFDIVFAEAQRNPATDLLTYYDVGRIKKDLQNLQKSTDADTAFAKSFESGADVILGFFVDYGSVSVGSLPPPLVPLTTEEMGSLILEPRSGATGNVTVLQDATPSAGTLTTAYDADGKLRRSPLVVAYKDGLYPSLSLAAGMSYLFAEDINLKTENREGFISIASLAITEFVANTNSHGKVLVPYIGKQRSFPYISATDVLNGNVEEGALDGAVVFVGTSAVGLADLRTTPFENGYPGVEIHATILRGLLEGGIPFKPDWEAGLIRVLIIVLGFGLAILLPKFGPVGLIALGSSTLFAYVGGNYYLWSKNYFDLSLAPIVILITSLTVINIALGFFKESSRRKDLKDMFGQYVPPAHIDKMVDSGDQDAFASDSREMTVLFSDIRSFTNMSEGLTAEELKQLLNEYFTPITKIIFETEGTIDKYVGDMVMAFWGAPLEDKNHRSNAITAALQMQEKTEELKAEFKAKGRPEINIGVGLNTGTMNVGDMGSQYRKAYTVLGDAVNLGSRLESLTKFYGAKVLVGEGTTQGVDDYTFRHMDRIQVKGKEEAVEVYEPLGKTKDLSEKELLELANYHDILGLYWAKDWDKAKTGFEALLKDSPTTLIYQIYLDRMQATTLADLAADWDGTFRHTSK